MYNLGQLVYQLRMKQGLSAKDLAEDICSVKYIYMIENGERFPTATILHKIFVKLRYDYWKYLEFSDLEHNSEIIRLVDEIDELRDICDYKKIIEKTTALELITDGELYEYIVCNEICCLYYGKEEEEEALKKIQLVLRERNIGEFDSKKLKHYSLHQLELYNVIGSIYCSIDCVEKGIYIIKSIYEYFEEMNLSKSFEKLIVVNTIRYAEYFIANQQDEKAIAILENLLQKKRKNSVSYQSVFVYYNLSVATYHLGKYEKAMKYNRIAKHIEDYFKVYKMNLQIQELFEHLQKEILEDNKEWFQTKTKRYLLNKVGKREAVIRLISPNILFISFYTLNIQLVEKVYQIINEQLVDFFENETEGIHIVYDITKLELNGNGTDVHALITSLNQKTSLFMNVKRKGMARIQNKSQSDQLWNLVFDFLEYQEEDQLAYRMRGNSIEEIIAYIKIVEDIRIERMLTETQKHS